MKLKAIRNKLKGNPELEKIEAAVSEDGSVDLSEVYEMPTKAPENKLSNTVDRLMDKNGLADEKAYHKEYKLRAAHQILINGGSVAKIAEMLNITLTEANAIRRELNRRLVNEVKTLDKHQVVGQALMFYDSVQAKFLQMAQLDPQNKDKNLRSKIEALKGSLQAQSEKQKLLKDIGFWREGIDNGESLKDTHVDGAMDLRDMAQMIISGEEFEIDTSEEEEEDEINLVG